jgi:hypothetical protein
MLGRTRPIEKFAEATAKCAPEVEHPLGFIVIIVADLKSRV